MSGIDISLKIDYIHIENKHRHIYRSNDENDNADYHKSITILKVNLLAGKNLSDLLERIAI